MIRLKALRISVIVLLFTSIVPFAHGQKPVIEWQQTYGSRGRETLSAFVYCKNKDLILAGHSNAGTSPRTDKPWIGGSNFYWILRSDSAGNILREKNLGGKNLDYLTAMSATSDGGIICGGHSNSKLNIPGYTGGITDKGSDFDFLIYKLDSGGTVQFEVVLGGNRDEYLCSVFQTTDGGYICGGTSYSHPSVSKTSAAFGETDYWLVKLDSAGNIMWQATYGGDSYDRLTSVTQTDDDGGYILAGYSLSGKTGNRTIKNKNHVGYDLWIVKITNEGNVIWQNSFTGLSRESDPEVITTQDGGYMIGSTTSVQGDAKSVKKKNFRLLKLDPQGKLHWEKTYGGSANDLFKCIRQCSDGGFVIGGDSDSKISGNKSQRTLGGYDYWIVKTDSIGKMEWDVTIGGVNNDNISDIQQISDNEFIVGGTTSTDGFGSTLVKVENRRKEEYHLVKLKVMD